MTTPTAVGRRSLLRGLVGAGAAAAALAVPRAALAGETQTSLVLDVACLGDTFRFIPAPGFSPPGDSPLYGSPFLVEGNVYEEGALEGRDGFDPYAAGGPTVIGTWLCRGWIMSRDERPEPMVASTQLYVFPGLGVQAAPSSQLVSDGLEGLPGSVTRTVTGGSGSYAGVHGTVGQRQIGANATGIGPAGALDAGPNFRFTFHLVASAA